MAVDVKVACELISYVANVGCGKVAPVEVRTSVVALAMMDGVVEDREIVRAVVMGAVAVVARGCVVKPARGAVQKGRHRMDNTADDVPNRSGNVAENLLRNRRGFPLGDERWRKAHR